MGVDEHKLEYALIVGNRWMRIFGDRWVQNSGRAGITIDIFAGIGLGYRITENNFPESYEKYFKDVKRNKLTIPLRFGVNIGYVF